MIPRAAIPLFWIGLSPLLAQGLPAARLLDEIEVRAAAEPPVLGIDTQIRAAVAVAARSPEDAARLLRSAESRIAALSHLPSRTYLLSDWLTVQEPFDPEAAEFALRAFAGSLPPRPLDAGESEAMRHLAARISKRFPAFAEQFRNRAAAPSAKPTAQSGSTLFTLKTSSLDGMRPDDVLLLARKERDPAAALDLLMHIMDNEDDPRRRLSILNEALDLSAKVDDLADRLLAQSMLTRRLHDSGDTPRAAIGAHMLAESFEQMFHCDTAACDHFDGEDNPGEIIYAFAEYLREHKIPPERLGLEHPSLRVRLMLLDLGQ
jgi:hypothetical protein